MENPYQQTVCKLRTRKSICDFAMVRGYLFNLLLFQEPIVSFFYKHKQVIADFNYRSLLIIVVLYRCKVRVCMYACMYVCARWHVPSQSLVF